MARWQFGPRGTLTNLRMPFRKLERNLVVSSTFGRRFLVKSGLIHTIKLYGLRIEKHGPRKVKLTLPEDVNVDRASRLAEHILRWPAKAPLRRVAIRILRSDRSRNRFGY